MSNIIPLPKKIAGSKPPVKRNELILVMANRLLEQARAACNKSADALDAESQAIDAEIVALGKGTKPQPHASWSVDRSTGWSGQPAKGELYVRCAEVTYANVAVVIPEDLKQRMFAHKLAVHKHVNEFSWLGVYESQWRPANSFGKDAHRRLARAKEKARALLGEPQAPAMTSTENRVAQMLADPEFVRATDLFIKRLASAPKQLAG